MRDPIDSVHPQTTLATVDDQLLTDMPQQWCVAQVPSFPPATTSAVSA
jgi:hypothetical protein